MAAKKGLLSQISTFDLRLLRIFKAVVENGGFAAAEIELNISRPAISTAIADLETRLGLSLAQRGRAGFSLTSEGQEVYESVLQLFTSMETFRSQVNSLHANLKGDLNIGITDNLVTLEHMNISNALSELKVKGADVRINIRMTPPVEVERGVIDGKLHVGVVPQLNNLAGLDYYPLYEEYSYLYCSDSHPLYSLKDVDSSQVSKAEFVASAAAQNAATKKIEQEFNDKATATDREGIAFLILTGDYIGFLPDHFAKRWLHQGKMKVLMPKVYNYSTEYVAITRKGARPNLVVKTFLDNLL